MSCPKPAETTVADEPAIARNAEAIERRSREWRPEYSPKGLVQEWLFRQVVINSVLIDVYQAEYLEMKPKLAERACTHWNADRRAQVEALGSKLHKKPSEIAHKIRMTSHGCAWMIERWEVLQAVLDAGQDWTPEQRSLAFDLLGKPRELRTLDPWFGLAGPAELVARELEELADERDGMAHDFDLIEQHDACRSMEVYPVPALDRLRRRESAAFRRLQWAQEQLKAGVTSLPPEVMPAVAPEPEPESEPMTDADYIAVEQAFWKRFLTSPDPLPEPDPTAPPSTLGTLGRSALERRPLHLNRHARRAAESKARRGRD